MQHFSKKKLRIKKIKNIILCGFLLVTACSMPAHVQKNENGDWLPDNGYVWVDRQDLQRGVIWKAGLSNRDYPNVLAAEAEGNWIPVEGYKWVNDNSSDLSVAWQPGQACVHFAHVKAAEAEGSWIPDPGYAFSEEGKVSQVVWTPGLQHPVYSNVVSMATESYWLPKAGYKFSDQTDISTAVWTSGLYHPDFSHVVSSDTEGKWAAESGYRFANLTEGDFNVVPVETYYASQTQPEDNATPWQKFWRVAIPIAVAVVANKYAEPQANDGAGARYVGRPFAGLVREAAVETAEDEMRK